LNTWTLIDDSYIPCLLSLHFIFCWKLIYGEIFQGTLAIADMMIEGKITNNNLYKFYVSYNRRNQYLDFLRNEDKEQNYAKNLDGWTSHFRKCKYKLRFSNCIALICRVIYKWIVVICKTICFTFRVKNITFMNDWIFKTMKLKLKKHKLL